MSLHYQSRKSLRSNCFSFYKRLIVVLVASWGLLPTARAELVTTNFGSNIYELNPANGTVLRQYNRVLLTPFFNTTDFRSNGRMYGLQGSELFQVDLSTGSTNFSLVGAAPSGGSLAFSPTDQLFLVNASTLTRIDPNTGAGLGSVSVTSGGNNISLQGIDFAPNGQLYGATTTAIFSIDSITGVATRITPVGQNATGSVIITELDYGADNVIRAVVFNTDQPLWAINPLTGLGAPIHSLAPSGSPYSSVASIAIPEPGSCLGLIGLSMIGFRPLRKRC